MFNIPLLSGHPHFRTTFHCTLQGRLRVGPLYIEYTCTGGYFSLKWLFILDIKAQYIMNLSVDSTVLVFDSIGS